ncbi:hypothetical protein CMK21_05915 [Candidatus Poribacteria bacterium]|nr:hypothetical protein [Candidatus Poribacteria bacterium]
MVNSVNLIGYIVILSNSQSPRIVGRMRNFIGRMTVLCIATQRGVGSIGENTHWIVQDNLRIMFN